MQAKPVKTLNPRQSPTQGAVSARSRSAARRRGGRSAHQLSAAASAARTPPPAGRRAAGTPSGERHQNEGHGRRLTHGLRSARGIPRPRRVARQAPVGDLKGPRRHRRRGRRRRVRRRPDHRRASPRQPRPDRRRQGRDASSAPSSMLSPQTVQAVASRVRTFDFFERASVWDAAPERFRLHALATQHAADRIAAEVGYENRDRLTVTSLLHDVGKLVLLHAYPGYPSQVHRGARTPEERHPPGAPRARRRPRPRRRRPRPPLGAARLARPPRSSATTTPTPKARPRSSAWPTCSPTTPRAARCPPSEMLHTARTVGLGPAELRTVMYELPTAGGAAPAPRRPVPALRRASSGSCSALPRARSTSRSPTS